MVILRPCPNQFLVVPSGHSAHLPIPINFYTKPYYKWLWWRGQETFSFYPQCGGGERKGEMQISGKLFFLYEYELQNTFRIKNGNIKQKFQ